MPGRFFEEAWTFSASVSMCQGGKLEKIEGIKGPGKAYPALVFQYGIRLTRVSVIHVLSVQNFGFPLHISYISYS